MNAAITWVEGPIVNSKELRAWEVSLNQCSPKTRIIVATSDKSASPFTDNTQIYHFDAETLYGKHVMHRRWEAYRQILQDSDFDHVLFADSRDLVFQRDPFDKDELPEWPKGGIMAVSEGWKASGHPWCAEQHRVASKVFHGSVGGDEINGGLQVGTHQAMLALAAGMEALMYNGLPNDQASLNFWFKRMCHVPVQFAPEFYYLHGEAMKHGKVRARVDETCVARFGAVAAAAWHQYDRTGHYERVLKKYSPTMEESHMIVVSRYMEGMDWLRYMPWRNADTFVINKGLDRTVASDVSLVNVGFEAQSWAWFFHKYYETLPAVMACVQGDPFGHVTPEQFKHLWNRRTDCGWAPIADPGCWEWTDMDYPNHAGLPLRGWWSRLFPDRALPLRWLSWHGGQFIVSRDVIKSYPRSFWGKLAKTIKTRDDACALERLWGNIFGASGMSRTV